MGFQAPCFFCSSTNASAARSPTAASTTAPTPITSRTANSKPPTTAPTTPFHRSSFCSPPDLSAAIVELFLSTILGARIYGYVDDPLWRPASPPPPPEPARKAEKCSPSPTYPQAPQPTKDLMLMK